LQIRGHGARVRRLEHKCHSLERRERLNARAQQRAPRRLTPSSAGAIAVQCARELMRGTAPPGA
jgi:hypothetical protein